VVKRLTAYLYQISVYAIYIAAKHDGVVKMVGRSDLSKLALAACAWAAFASPALADVKAGVDAWSRGEYDAAVKQWRDPALKGDPDAQFNMGQAYKMGRGVQADFNVALDWYKRAAAQGHLQAADSYGHLLHYQNRVKEALPYLEASALRSDPRAQYLLGTELFNGVHIEKDWVRAYALMTRASSAGMAPASRSLAQMDQYIPLEQRQQATVLAGEMEQNGSRARAAQVAGFPINTTPSAKPTKPVKVPPSKAATTPVAAVQPQSPVKIATASSPAAKKVPATDGAWRIQLGAFGDAANAQKLWQSLERKIGDLAGLRSYRPASGNVTRLQAGPFATRGAAETICGKVKAAGQPCIVVPR
jgi:uncharacterized protein